MVRTTPESRKVMNDQPEDIVIYGNGAIARILHSIARRTTAIKGFTVDDHCIPEGHDRFCGLPIVPFSRLEETFNPKRCKLILAVGFLEMNELRARKYDEAKARGYSFASYVHESVFIHDDVVIGESCIVLDHVSIHPGSTIGRGTFISSNVNVGHDCNLAPYNWINSGVAIAGGCNIGAGCFFGPNSCTAHGVTLGDRTFVAPNTLVSRSTGNDEVYVSAPGEKSRLSSKAFLTFSRIFGEPGPAGDRKTRDV